MVKPRIEVIWKRKKKKGLLTFWRTEFLKHIKNLLVLIYIYIYIVDDFCIHKFGNRWGTSQEEKVKFIKYFLSWIWKNDHNLGNFPWWYPTFLTLDWIFYIFFPLLFYQESSTINLHIYIYSLFVMYYNW